MKDNKFYLELEDYLHFEGPEELYHILLMDLSKLSRIPPDQWEKKLTEWGMTDLGETPEDRGQGLIDDGMTYLILSYDPSEDDQPDNPHLNLKLEIYNQPE